MCKYIRKIVIFQQQAVILRKQYYVADKKFENNCCKHFENFLKIVMWISFQIWDIVLFIENMAFILQTYLHPYTNLYLQITYHCSNWNIYNKQNINTKFHMYMYTIIYEEY